MDGLELGRPMEGKPRDLSDETQPVCFGYIVYIQENPEIQMKENLGIWLEESPSVSDTEKPRDLEK